MLAKKEYIPDILTENFLPYAYSTIEDRAIPGIDGLKPVARKILYTMHLMKLYGKKTKSANIVGQTMRLHPHGDASIYDAMAKLTTGHEALLAPYVESKGSFNKVYSRDMACAASRYTEAGLAEIAKEVMDNLDENAVDMVDNYDGTMKEPVIMPVKFPTVLVNAVPGIAVGMASAIPTYNLKDVCNATIGIINGDIKDYNDLYDVLIAPDFTTKGIIHCNEKNLRELIRTGKETVVISGKYRIEKNIVNVTEIPYRAYMEDIRDTIIEGIKNKDFPEINSVIDTTGIDGFGLQIEFKTRGAEGYIENTMARIMYMTTLQNKVHFQANVLIDGKPQTLGIYELLKEWIRFRENTVKRIYQFRYNKKKNEQEKLIVWEMMGGRYKEILEIIASSTEAEAREKLADRFGFNEVQLDYILNLATKNFTKDKEKKSLEELEKNKLDCEKYIKVVNDVNERYEIIKGELKEIAEKYGVPRRTEIGEAIDTRRAQVKEIKKAQKFKVFVAITPDGYAAKFDSESGLNKFMEKNVAFNNRLNVIECNNTDTVLIFKANGNVYKMCADNIELNAKSMRFNVNTFCEDRSQVVYFDVTSDFKGSVIMVNYETERVVVIPYSRLISSRKKCTGVYDALTDEKRCHFTKEKKFFVVTRKKSVRMMNIETDYAEAYGRTYTFSLGRMKFDDAIFGVLDYSKAVDVTPEEEEMYSKDYFVKLKRNLW